MAGLGRRGKVGRQAGVRRRNTARRSDTYGCRYKVEEGRSNVDEEREADINAPLNARRIGERT